MSTAASGNPGGDDDRRPSDPSTYVNLTVRNQDESELKFRIKRGTRLQKLMIAYCNRLSIDVNSHVFTFDGCKIQPEQTPNELKLEEGDVIDVFLNPSALRS